MVSIIHPMSGTSLGRYYAAERAQDCLLWSLINSKLSATVDNFAALDLIDQKPTMGHSEAFTVTMDE